MPITIGPVVIPDEAIVDARGRAESLKRDAQLSDRLIDQVNYWVEALNDHARRLAVLEAPKAKWKAKKKAVKTKRK